MIDLSVLICAHNPRVDFLRRTLDALKKQTLALKDWELILVDNASKSPLEESWDLSWHPNAKHVLESELGLSVARQRGRREATSDLLVFVDDDNVLDETYLVRALDIKEKWPSLGVWGSGTIIPEFEQRPEAFVEQLLPYLALREAEREFWSNVYPCIDATPWGAGMCVRAKVADEYGRMYNESEISISGRRGTTLLSGEDVEIAYVACRLGLGMGVFPELKVTHLISKARVSPTYLLKLYEGTETSNALLAYKWSGLMPRSTFSPRSILAILHNFIVRRLFERRIYYAKLRALMAARRIILLSRSGKVAKE
jgi:glycosyltransferase involved in cell wall biosynthesis